MNYSVNVTRVEQDEALTTFTAVITPELPVGIDEAKADIKDAVSNTFGDEASVYVAPAVSEDGETYREDAFEAIIVQRGAR